MKSVAFFLLAFCATISAAADPSRSFVCSADDSMGRQSELTFNVDAKTVSMKSVDGSSAVQIVYDEKTSCGLKVSTSEKCVTQLNHNLDKLDKPYPAMAGSVRCILASRPVIEHDGNFELNRFGDGSGYFVCGRLSKFDLTLSNCSMAAE